MTTTYTNNRVGAPKATFSIPSILAIISAIASFAVDGAGWALILSIAAGVLGLIGVAAALLPGVRGGFVSIFSIFLGALGVITAIVRIVVPG
jgi:hypothetical protein